jgi:hypothetical protein
VSDTGNQPPDRFHLLPLNQLFMRGLQALIGIEQFSVEILGVPVPVPTGLGPVHPQKSRLPILEIDVGATLSIKVPM